MSSQCISVLIIEDNRGDARLVQEALKGATAPSFTVEWVDRLSIGLARLAEGGIDVLLLDLGLPDSQGLEALALIRALAPTVPVVVLSGAGDEQFAVEAVQAGAQDYLVKAHANPHLLTRALRYAIERKRADEGLRESEERLRLAMTAANEAIWEYNPITGYALWNEAYSDASGGAPKTWCPAELGKRIHDEDRERVLGSLFEALEGQAVSWSAQYRLLRADGQWSYIHDRAVIARDTTGKATRVVGAMLDVTSLKRAEEALQQSNQRLQRLSRDLLRAQDYERRRIARELHDSTAQLLAALGMNLSRLKEPGLAPERRAQALAEATDLAAACSAEIRTVTYLLHPPLLDEVGLPAALQAYAQGFNQRTGIEVEIEVAPDFERLGAEVEATLFRIVQEGLANVHKHSGSPSAIIRLERDDHEVRLVLGDRGRGLPEALRTPAKGFVRFGVGIMGMRERAEQLGGRLVLASNGGGAKLTVALPLGGSNEENKIIVS
ncbi:MAG: response regulator [Bryobacteraceae bacterium]